ncbi:MAG: hypothetical protein IT337_00110 [Thermomicrobiales bacterium]|nr:hypothetical protein [Thermomicrobiales bacterium]
MVPGLGQEAWFDAWTRVLAPGQTRRTLVAGAIAGAVAAAFGRVIGEACDKRKGDGKPGKVEVERCVPNGRTCGATRRRGKKRGKSCSRCCSTSSIQTNNGKRKRACAPDGKSCGDSSQCCSGRYAGGVCASQGGSGQACEAPNVICGGACTNVNRDANNCGICGHACPSDANCRNGGCFRRVSRQGGGTFTIVGGTGRFAGATGSGSLAGTGSSDPVTGEGSLDTFTLTGDIAYA